MTQWTWLDERDARVLHERLLTLHGGSTGLRNAGSLASALARPTHIATYDGDADACALAAAYTAGIVKNPPFVDGNKRTGFVLGILFLEINGFAFTAGEEEATQAVLDLAAGAIDMRGYAEFLRANAAPT